MTWGREKFTSLSVTPLCCCLHNHSARIIERHHLGMPARNKSDLGFCVCDQQCASVDLSAWMAQGSFLAVVHCYLKQGCTLLHPLTVLKIFHLQQVERRYSDASSGRGSLRGGWFHRSQCYETALVHFCSERFAFPWLLLLCYNRALCIMQKRAQRNSLEQYLTYVRYRISVPDMIIYD